MKEYKNSIELYEDGYSLRLYYSNGDNYVYQTYDDRKEYPIDLNIESEEVLIDGIRVIAYRLP